MVRLVVRLLIVDESLNHLLNPLHVIRVAKKVISHLVVLTRVPVRIQIVMVANTRESRPLNQEGGSYIARKSERQGIPFILDSAALITVVPEEIVSLKGSGCGEITLRLAGCVLKVAKTVDAELSVGSYTGKHIVAVLSGE